MLRVATRAAHDRVDALFSGFDLASASGYRAFLMAQAAAFLPAEAALEAAGAGALFPGWDKARRSELLAADLDELGLGCPAVLGAPALPSPAATAGTVYVLEGSRLGGALLSRRVASGLPRRFLSASLPPGQWSAFLARLELVLGSDVERRDAVTGARHMFGLFASAATLPTEVP